MTQEEALRMALEALEGADQIDCDMQAAITAIKEALAQPKQEPLAWISTGPARMIHWTADKPAYGDDWVPLYTTPPQRQPLTDEEVIKLKMEGRDLEFVNMTALHRFARAIEASHGIKENT